MTNLQLFAQQKTFTKYFFFWNLLIVLENLYLEQMVGNWLKKNCIKKLSYTYTYTFFYHHWKYLSFQTWPIFIWGLFKSYCAMLVSIMTNQLTLTSTSGELSTEVKYTAPYEISFSPRFCFYKIANVYCIPKEAGFIILTK